MEEIRIQLQVRPMTFPNTQKVREVKDAFPGPMCVTCKCGKHFASFKMNPDDEFNAFRNSLQIAARNVMRKKGLIRPLAGAIAIEVEVGVQRPVKHYEDDGSTKEDYRYRVPMMLPAYYRIMESVSKCLYDVAFTDMKQIAKASFARVYRETHCIEVIIKEVNPSDVDGEIKQLELF